MNKKKKLLLIITLFLIKITPLFAAEQYGVLNVFTDLPEATIYVDGLLAGQESIIKLPLPIGDHYVQVKLNNNVAYAEKITIYNNRSTTVVSDHFVDIITNTPSRGAIDREAARLRESRGNFALGLSYQTDPQPAASIKWWAFDRVGFQALMLGHIPNTDFHGLFGGRIFISPADKIFGNDVLTGYMFGGAGIYRKPNKSNIIDDKYYLEMGMGVEAKVGDLVGNLLQWKYENTPMIYHYSSDSEDDSDKDFVNLIRELVILGVTHISYTSAEISIIKQINGSIVTGFNLGLHVYF